MNVETNGKTEVIYLPYDGSMFNDDKPAEGTFVQTHIKENGEKVLLFGNDEEYELSVAMVEQLIEHLQEWLSTGSLKGT